MIDFFVCSYRLSDTSCSSTFLALEDLVVDIYLHTFIVTLVWGPDLLDRASQSTCMSPFQIVVGQ